MRTVETAILILMVFCRVLNSYKILIYAPQMAYSHVTFLGKIADTLVSAGHDVVVYVTEFHPNVKTNGTTLARIVYRKRDFDIPIEASYKRLMNAAWTTRGESLTEVLALIKMLATVQITLCEKILNDDVELQSLRNERFDVGIAEVMSFCGLPLFSKIGIKAHIDAFATSLTEGLTEHFGVSNNPSFVPALFSSSLDTMSYIERFRNFFEYLVARSIIEFIAKPASFAVIQKHMPTTYDLTEDSAQSSFVFVNADELLDFARPVTQKIIYVGGNAVSKPKPLNKEYEEIINSAASEVILISFGTIAKSNQMQNETKEAFVAMFKEFSNVTFIWKYETDDNVADGLPNVFKKAWIPQNDLLNHPKMRGFISHGGLNSLTESVYAGIPIICVPLLGDQMRNAKMIEKHGLGIILDKLHLNSQTLRQALAAILTDRRYKDASQRMAKMIANKPVSATDRVVKYTEFAAKFVYFTKSKNQSSVMSDVPWKQGFAGELEDNNFSATEAHASELLSKCIALAKLLE